MNVNFPASLAFVWAIERDSPLQGYHVTPHDPGGGTLGGVTEATWKGAVTAGIVKGALKDASIPQLSAVLRIKFWGITCDALPHGVDLLYFNGVMMTGRFPKLFQQCLGFMGDDIDGWIGPQSLVKTRARDPQTLIHCVVGCHAAYLQTLDAWSHFGNGWTARIQAVQSAAIAMADTAPIA